LSNSSEQILKVGQLFENVLNQNYGSFIPPDPFITPTSIRPLDTILGGGLVSSGIIMLSSTPETGKSTFAFQFSKLFLDDNEDSLVFYLDIEGAGNTCNNNEYRIARTETFELTDSRFIYKPLVINVLNVFEIIEKIIETKKAAENKIGRELKVLIIWDSVTATPSAKTEDAISPDKIIGVKARQLGFCIEKYSGLLKFNKITFLCIDQVRSNLKIDIYSKEEKTVGNFGNVKSASSIYALNHAAQQWLFFSKKDKISPSDNKYDNIDGWAVDVLLEKSKTSPSNHAITCIFDKNRGFDKFWTEMNFLSEPTPEENKFYNKKNNIKNPFEFYIKRNGAWYKLVVSDRNDPKIKYESKQFYFRDAKKLYEENEEFHSWFDYTVNLSCQERLINGIMRVSNSGYEVTDNGETVDTLTGEILDEFNNIEINNEVKETEEENLE
jgi:RecA/RadA recombinase